MKRKLSEGKSSYKNVYLSVIKKTQIFSDSWARYSLIGLLATKFFGKKKLVNSVNLHLITLSIRLIDSKKNRRFLLNILMFFLLPTFFSLYRSNTISLIGINNFTLTKIRRQNNLGKNYIGIYRKSFQDFNKFLDIFLHNIFRREVNRLSRYEFFDIFSRFNNQMFFEQINDLIYNSKFFKNFLDYYFLDEEGNQDCLWLRKQVLQNLQDWGEPRESLVKSSFLLKKKKICYNPLFFFEPLLIDEESRQKTISTETFTKFTENLSKFNGLGKDIESDDFEIISCNSQKYYSNFMHNYHLPLDSVYEIIHQDYSFDKIILYELRKKYNPLFVRIMNLSSIFSEFKKTFLLISCIELEKYSVIRTNELDIVIAQSKKNKEDPNFIRKTLLMFGKKDDIFNNGNKYINSCYNYYNNFFIKILPLKILGSDGIYKNTILRKYPISWENFSIKSFIYDIKNVRHKKLSFGITQWLYEIRNSAKRLVPYNFFIEIEFLRIFGEFFQDSGSEDHNKISDSLLISADTRSSYVERDEISTQILIKNVKLGSTNLENFVDEELWISEVVDNDIMIDLSNPIFVKNHLLFKNHFLVDWIRNRKLLSNFSYKIHLYNSLINFGSNYKDNFLFYSEKNYIENNKILYLQLLKNHFGDNISNEIRTGIGPIFIGKEISKFVQFKLERFSVSKIFGNKFDKIKFLFFYNSRREVSKQTKFHLSMNSKIYFSLRGTNRLETIFTNNQFGIKKIGTEIVANLKNKKIREYYNILQFESLTKRIEINNSIFQSINKIYLSPISKYSKLKNLKNEIGEKTPIQRDPVYNRFDQIQSFHRFEKKSLVGDSNYIDWFFTFEWWGYSLHIFWEILRKQFVIIGCYFDHSTDSYITLIQQNLANLYVKVKNLYTLNPRWNSRLFLDHTGYNISKFSWSDFDLVKNFDNLQWTFISSIVLISLFYQNFFSIFIGSNFIKLWKHFENIKYLTDISRTVYFTELFHRDKTQLDKREKNLFINFFSNFKHYIKNIRFYLLTKRILDNWLINHKSLDLSRRKRNVLVQSLITPKRIKEYGFRSYYQRKTLNNQLFEYYGNPQQGLSHIRDMSGTFKKNLVDYPLHRTNKWIFLASLQKIISSQTLWQRRKFNPKFRKIPISLQLGLSGSKGLLLIGPIESGRSYLIKNLAADCSLPLLGISIDKLMYNKPDVVTESWMNILIESLRRLNLISDLARGMSPCIIWIRNIHELDINRPTQNIESEPTFLLGILLKLFQTNSLKRGTKNDIVIIGSTHLPKEVDPSFISPDRLDRVINIRLLNVYQRKSQFPILLGKNNLQLNSNFLSYFDEFGSGSLGYNIRDLVALTNEVSLISLTKNESLVYDDIVRLAFHRQIFGFSHTDTRPNYKQNFKILLYKIGRAIIQNIMIEGSTTNPLNISNSLWKRKFYYLSKWYLEPSMDDSIIKESTILAHVLVCLAGVAARDSWFLLEKNSHKSISLDKSIENDLDLAFSILENFSIDFPWLETCGTRSLNHGENKQKMFLTKNLLDIMHSGIFAVTNRKIVDAQTDSPEYGSQSSKNEILDRKICEFGDTARSPRSWRLNFSRSYLFNWIKRPNDLESFHPLGISKKNLSGRDKHDQFISGKKEQLFYERILPRVRKRNIEELEFQFENILLDEQFEILGFFGPSTRYQMEYGLDNKPKLFIGKRILWDPAGYAPKNRHFVFSHRDFFADEEMLRRLYITYGVRRERERSLSSHRIRRFFICRGYNKNLINKLSIRWWNQLPIDQKQNIYMLKQVEKIGIRLKRPQIFTPVYLYQRWLIENIPEKFSRFDLLTHRDRWIKINKLLLNDSFTYKILLESYQYLFDFFLSNKILLTRMTKTLLKKKWIFRNEILNIIENTKNVRNEKEMKKYI